MNEQSPFNLAEDGWFNIAAPGEWPHKPTGLVQVLDGESMDQIVKAFVEFKAAPNWPGILIDFDHQSLDADKPTVAAGWIVDLAKRDNGLWAQVRWSDIGRKSIEGGRYRFISPVWKSSDCAKLDGDRIRPLKLMNCAVTNDPNIKGLFPLSNTAGAQIEFSPPPMPIHPEPMQAPSSPSALPKPPRIGMDAALFNRALHSRSPRAIANRRPLTRQQEIAIILKSRNGPSGQVSIGPAKNDSDTKSAGQNIPAKSADATAGKQTPEQQAFLLDAIGRAKKAVYVSEVGRAKTTNETLRAMRAQLDKKPTKISTQTISTPTPQTNKEKILADQDQARADQAFYDQGWRKGPDGKWLSQYDSAKIVEREKAAAAKPPAQNPATATYAPGLQAGRYGELQYHNRARHKDVIKNFVSEAQRRWYFSQLDGRSQPQIGGPNWTPPGVSNNRSVAKAALEGFLEGAKGGATILLDKFTYGQIEKLAKEAEKYQGPEYNTSRVAGVVAREALISAAGASLLKAWKLRNVVNVALPEGAIDLTKTGVVVKSGWGAILAQAALQFGDELSRAGITIYTENDGKHDNRARRAGILANYASGRNYDDDQRRAIFAWYAGSGRKSSGRDTAGRIGNLQSQIDALESSRPTKPDDPQDFSLIDVAEVKRQAMAEGVDSGEVLSRIAAAQSTNAERKSAWAALKRKFRKEYKSKPARERAIGRYLDKLQSAYKSDMDDYVKANAKIDGKVSELRAKIADEQIREGEDVRKTAIKDTDKTQAELKGIERDRQRESVRAQIAADKKAAKDKADAERAARNPAPTAAELEQRQMQAALKAERVYGEANKLAQSMAISGRIESAMEKFPRMDWTAIDAEIAAIRSSVPNPSPLDVKDQNAEIARTVSAYFQNSYPAA